MNSSSCCSRGAAVKDAEGGDYGEQQLRVEVSPFAHARTHEHTHTVTEKQIYI